jgi:DNA replication protein DnaC
MDLVEIITYLTIGLAIYYVLMELTKPRQGAQSWISWGFIAALFILVGWFFWSRRKRVEKVQEQIVELDTEELEPEEDYEDYNQEIYTPQEKAFNIVNGAQKITGTELTYEDFKFWYQEPTFVEKYTKAVKEALKIKKRRLIEVRNKCHGDLKAVQRGDKKNNLASLFKDLNDHDDSKTIERTIHEIDILIQEIKTREDTLTIEEVRKGLYDAINDKKFGIEAMIGRDDIKDFLSLQLYTFAQNPRIFFSKFQNVAIYGSAGVGKSFLAQVIGHVYANSGILVRNHVHIVTKQAMTTAYVDESGKKTRKLLLANLESVVFIDEAYDMTPPTSLLGKGVDHGHEAIAELVNFIDKMKGLSIIIVAGYEDEMEERFMKANEGLPRRFPYKLLLKHYDPKALTNILIRFLLEANPGLKFTNEQGNYLYTIIEYINENRPETFQNQAGDMDNLSGFISRSIYGTPGITWAKDYEQIIMSGTNSFLSLKGITLEALN